MRLLIDERTFLRYTSYVRIKGGLMEILWMVPGIIMMLILPFAVTQFVMRLLKVNQKIPPKKVWRIELPTKQECKYAVLATIGLIILMITWSSQH